MYKVARIIFKPRNAFTEVVSDSVVSILTMLYKNGQISEGWSVEKHDQIYVANVVTTDDDSLNPEHYNQYIIKETENFDVETHIICDEATASDSCHCLKHSSYILAVEPYIASSPVICGDCGKEIPLYKVPCLYGEKEHYSILNFQKTYQAVLDLWFDSLSDRFTKRQITAFDSRLNKRGLDIRSELELKVDKPVYYLLLNPIGGWFDFEKNNKSLKVCPKCGKELAKFDGCYADKACVDCRFAFINGEEK